VLSLVEAGFFKQGDYFIVNNASVHYESDAFPILCELLDLIGVNLVFLPKYLPELNPCEKVFSLIKNHLRCYHGNAWFWQEILKSLSTIAYWHIYKFYKNAIVL
jgi:hypothetical protein